MAIVLPSVPGDPLLGRRRGSIFYQAKGRTIVRARTKPVVPSTLNTSLPRGMVATAAKNWAYTLTEVNKNHFDNWSKFAGRGMLEYVSLVMASQFAGLGLPLSRSNQPLPDPPIIINLVYASSPFFLTAEVFRPPPPVRNSVIYSATPPTPQTTRPMISDRRAIKSGPLADGPVDLVPDYLATFGGESPAGKSIMIVVELINENIPADTRTANMSATPFENDPHASGWVTGNPFQKLGSVPVTLIPNFSSQLPGTPVALAFSGNDLTSSFPATIPNAVPTTSSVDDVLGTKRTINFDFLFTAIAGESVTLPMGATVTI